MKFDLLRRCVAEFIGTFALVFVGCTTRAMVGDTNEFAGILPALIIEVVLTFFLMLVNMSSATDKRFKRADSGLAVGFVILASGLMANSLSGASMHPARSLGPALYAGGSALVLQQHLSSEASSSPFDMRLLSSGLMSSAPA